MSRPPLQRQLAARRRALAWKVKHRLSPQGAARARRGLAMLDRVRLPIAQRRLGEDRPIPPRELRVRIGAVDPAAFVSEGAHSAEEVLRGFAAAGRDPLSFDRLLDFGCGCGRIGRHLAHRLRPGAYHGSDVDESAIEWLSRHVPEGSFAANAFAPPLSFPDAHFDALFSVSIFTHLDSPAQLAWLEDIRRVLRPGGVALLSIHGRRAAERTWWGEGLSDNAADEINRRTPHVEEEGFVFVPFDDLDAEDKYEGVTGPYGNSFQSEDWTRREWGQHLEIEKILPAAVVGYQDFVVASRR